MIFLQLQNAALSSLIDVIKSAETLEHPIPGSEEPPSQISIVSSEPSSYSGAPFRSSFSSGLERRKHDHAGLIIRLRGQHLQLQPGYSRLSNPALRDARMNAVGRLPIWDKWQAGPWA